MSLRHALLPLALTALAVVVALRPGMPLGPGPAMSRQPQSAATPDQAQTGASTPANLSIRADSWPEADCESTLSIDCLYGLDGQQAVIGGRVANVDPERDHCALFATDDGGTSWNPLGPALPGHRVTSLFARDDGCIWALLRPTRAVAAQPLMLRTTDGGSTWARHHLDPELATGAAHMAIDPSGRGLLITEPTGAANERRWFVTGDHGVSWRMVQAYHSDEVHLGGDCEVRTPGGWGWCVRNDTIYRRRPGGRWAPVTGQPADAYIGNSIDVDCFALRPRTGATAG
ncbi:MAG: WD40/YVTN/BNR-like repeat-containing protein [Planctomycetota bacterium]